MFSFQDIVESSRNLVLSAKTKKTTTSITPEAVAPPLRRGSVWVVMFQGSLEIATALAGLKCRLSAGDGG